MRRFGILGLLVATMSLPGCGGGRTPPKDAAAGAGGELTRTWLAVRAEARAVDSLATAGDLGQARHHARTLHDTAALLPGLSGAYVSTRQGPLTYALRDMQAVVDTLTRAADQGDSVRVWQQAKKLQHTVLYIGGLYPTGLLPGAVQTPGGAYARPPEAAYAGVEKVALVCPMHPEVTREVPPDSVGQVTCPKCGMALVRDAAGPPAATADATTRSGAAPPPPARRHADHHSKHGGQFAMQGDYHLELVTRPDGRIELYVYDAWTKPLPLGSTTGGLTFEVAAGTEGPSEAVIALRASPATPGLLTAHFGDLARATAVTARLTLPDTTLSLTFPLGQAATPHPGR